MSKQTTITCDICGNETGKWWYKFGRWNYRIGKDRTMYVCGECLERIKEYVKERDGEWCS